MNLASSSSGSTTSPSLLSGLRIRDPEAWQRLADLYGPLVFHWGRQCELDNEDASDIMQEVFAAVATSVQKFVRDRGSFRGWLWTITRNKIRDLQRKRARRPREIGGSAASHHLRQVADVLSEEAGEPTSSTEMSNLFHRGLAQVRSEFEERTWQAFWRTVVEEHDTSEIAAEMGITANAVRQAKSRVLRRLRQTLGDSE